MKIDAIADDVVEGQQEQNRGARKRHLIEGFDELVRPRIHRIEQRPAGTTVRTGICVEVDCIGLRCCGRGRTVAVKLLPDAREGEDHAHHEDESGERNEEKRHGGRHVEVVFDVVKIFHKKPLLSSILYPVLTKYMIYFSTLVSRRGSGIPGSDSMKIL